jgi:uncharacterized protein (TIGR02757 family)
MPTPSKPARKKPGGRSKSVKSGKATQPAGRTTQRLAPTLPRTPEEWQALAPRFDQLVAQYKVPAYIQSDPIQIPYRFAQDPKACELVAFITALFSYGRRDLIIETVTNLFRIADNDPVAFLEAFHPQRDAKLFAHFVYRFNKGPDVVFLWQRLQWAYREFGSLEALFMHAMAQTGGPESRLKAGIAGFTDLLLGQEEPQSYGLKFLFAHPAKGGACKRFNMFLRWMVRQDGEPSGAVDFGLWKAALTPAELLVPLDTHIMNMNRQLRLTHRTDGSWQTAEAVTDVFRLLCPEDPVKYDYALFGFSLDKRPVEEILSSS